MKNHCIIVAAGDGVRAGGNQPKQYIEVGGKPLFLYSVALFADHPLFDKIVLVIKDDDEAFVKKILGTLYRDRVYLAVGGKRRYHSVYNGLKLLHEICEATDRVWIHDSARCCLNRDMIERLSKASPACRALTAAVPVTDTIKQSDGENNVTETLHRKHLWSIQTPQVFEMGLLMDAYVNFFKAQPSDITDDASIIEQFSGEQIKLVMGDYKNIKVTNPIDFEIAKLILSNKLG